MMAENPSFWWSLSGKPPLASQQPSTSFSPVPSSISMPPPPPSSNFFPPQYIFGTSPVVLPPSSLLHHDHYNQDHFPLSWSHLLMGGLASEEERGGTSSSTDHGQFKKLENWEDHILNNPSSRVPLTVPAVKVKQELDQSRQLMIYNNNTSHDHGDHDIDHHELQACSSSWSTQATANPIPSAACSSSSSVLDFSTNYKRENGRNQNSHHSSHQCNGTSTSGAPAKRARVQPSSSTQPPLKVRKEKLGDRITALHQIVSPFGKTDTASVLLEAIGFIRFLEGQIEALTSPYLGNASSASASATTMMQHYPGVKAEMQCINTEEPGEDRNDKLLNDDYQKQRGAAKQDEANDHTTTDLRSRGLCLVPISCTDHIDHINGSSEYWAPALALGGGGGF